MNKIVTKIFFIIESMLALLIAIGGMIQDDFTYILASMMLLQCAIQMVILNMVSKIGEFYE